MKAVLSLESANRRRELLSLLRELRRIRWEALESEQLLGKARAAVAAAGEVGGFVRLALRDAPKPAAPCHLCIALDQAMLHDVERRELLQSAFLPQRMAVHSEVRHE